jgi:hypothetical protein
VIPILLARLAEEEEEVILEKMARREVPLRAVEVALEVKCDEEAAADLEGGASIVLLIQGCRKALSGLILVEAGKGSKGQKGVLLFFYASTLTSGLDPNEDTLTKSRERGRRCN